MKTDLPHERPLLKPWYRLAHEDGRVLAQYGDSVVVFEGKATTRLLPALLPLLDGTRTLDEIAAVLGEAAAPAIANAVAALAQHDLLTAPSTKARRARPFEEAATLIAATARGDRSPAEVEERLRRADAAVLGSGSLADQVTRSLCLSGLERTQRVGDWHDRQTRTDLVVVAPAPGELPLLADWNRAALATATPWLQVLPFDGSFAALGPLFVPGETCCYECYRLRRAANVACPEEFWALETATAAYPSAPFFEQAVAGIVAGLALRWLVERDPFLPGVFYAFELAPRPSITDHHVYRVPRCPACSGLADVAPPPPWFEGALDHAGA